MPLIILEAMKTELQMVTPVSGTIAAIHCRSGRQVAAGDLLLVIEAT
jgi:urea carboxylase